VGAEPVAITVVRDLADLERLRGVWEGVGSAFPSPMQHHAWTAACVEAFGDRYEPAIVVVGPLDAPRAIAPLGRRRGSYELVGAYELMEPVDFLYRDADAAAELARALRKLGYPLRLAWLLADTPVPAALRGAYRFAVQRDGAGVPTIPLDGSDPEGALSSRHRQDLRRARRRADAAGEVTLEVHAPTQETLGPLLDEALAVEAASWKGGSGTALVADPLRLPFYRRYAERASKDGTFRIAFLRIGGRAAAMQYASESEGRWWLFKIGYDAEFARASPGQLLLLETLRHASARGLASYELLGSEDDWTRRWTTESRRWCSVRAYPVGPRSLPALAAEGARAARRRVRL
jgi:CelD/BcsL family acetyltransferase involved in cellulose biosynthesis